MVAEDRNSPSELTEKGEVSKDGCGDHAEILPKKMVYLNRFFSSS